MGNAYDHRQRGLTITVHPHVHGERQPFFTSFYWFNGSSPRTWGTHQRSIRADTIYRFIPTYMGNAVLRASLRLPTSVHPHVHGERIIKSTAVTSPVGSSPRTWGTHRRISTRRVSIRFIPTYMGNATSPRAAAAESSVHPHVHGER